MLMFPEVSCPSADEVAVFAAGRRGYVAGFALDDAGRVALVRKARPAWQAGKWNGIGGKIEPGETPAAAMRREFSEEAGLDVAGWQHLACLTFPAGMVFFFRVALPAGRLEQVRACTDEMIGVHEVAAVAGGTLPVIPNLRWLVPLAAYTHDRYAPLLVVEDNDGAPGQLAG